VSHRAWPRLGVVAAVLVAACAASPAGGGPPPVELTVLGAASLKAALEEARAAYQVAHPGTVITLSTDSSAALTTRIELGAPADVFLSADTSHPHRLVSLGLGAGAAVAFATNSLAIIAPVANPAGVTSPVDLARPRLSVIAAGDGVPITAYAEQFVRNLGREPGYPSDFVAAYHGNIVSREDNVTAVVARIELGEGDAAIVYATDARASQKVASVAFPAGATVAATYAGVVLEASSNRAAATQFLDWFAGPAGQVVLSRFGFLPPA
jgi:molybdate transport system substrate-binding protein